MDQVMIRPILVCCSNRVTFTFTSVVVVEHLGPIMPSSILTIRSFSDGRHTVQVFVAPDNH
jgi:hypothetical protein